MELFSVKSEGQYELSLAVFESRDAIAAVQIVHGMQEHKERYYDFARYLSDHRFHVVISDLRGHGSGAPVLSHIADAKGDELLIKDQQLISRWIGKRFPGIPLILFGHSMGTIISRVMLQTDSGLYAAAALSGYVNPNPASFAAVTAGNIMKKVKGSKKYSNLLHNLALGSFSKSIPDRKTDLDWLSYDEENVRKYMEDPLCGVEFTIGSYDALFHLLHRMGKAAEYTNVRKTMPVMLIAGKDDPCTGGGKGRELSRKVLSDAGFTNIRVITLEGMRHEILNESGRFAVYEDLMEFFQSAVKDQQEEQ